MAIRNEIRKLSEANLIYRITDSMWNLIINTIEMERSIYSDDKALHDVWNRVCTSVHNKGMLRPTNDQLQITNSNEDEPM
jgi:hypothetical protein